MLRNESPLSNDCALYRGRDVKCQCWNTSATFEFSTRKSKTTPAAASRLWCDFEHRQRVLIALKCSCLELWIPDEMLFWSQFLKIKQKISTKQIVFYSIYSQNSPDFMITAAVHCCPDAFASFPKFSIALLLKNFDFRFRLQNSLFCLRFSLGVTKSYVALFSKRDLRNKQNFKLRSHRSAPKKSHTFTFLSEGLSQLASQNAAQLWLCCMWRVELLVYNNERHK